MKQKLLLLFAVLAASLSAWAGNTITYKASEQLSLSEKKFTPNFTQHTYDTSTQTGTITFSSDVTVIGSSAFYNCTSLTSITIPESVTTIGNSAFNNCTSLTSITIPESVTTIGNSAFNSCTSLTSITIPESVTSIGESTFKGCTGLSTISIPAAVTSISKEAFYECSSLTSVSIPESVSSIGFSAFSGCKKLTSIAIPEGVTTISGYMFDGCTSLSSITIPSSVTEIGTYVFRDCKLKSITIPESVSSIGTATFNNCKSLTSISLPSSLSTISTNLFLNCTSLTSVTIPSSVTNIYSSAFNGCTKLTKIYSLNPTPPTLGTTVFKNLTTSNINLYVPSEGYMAYKTTDTWKDFSIRVQAGTLALNDEVEYTIDQNVTGCTLSYTRTVSSDNWMGVYLPFTIDVTEVEGTYATLTGVSDGVLEWTTVNSGTILNGTPFIFKPTDFVANEESREIVFTSSDGTLHKNSDVHPKTIGDYKLAGTYLTKTDMQGKYGLANGNFRIGGENAQPLKPYHIFLTVPASVSQSKAPVRSRINGVDATRIEGVEYEPISDGKARNLQGIEVGDGYKGIVIVNGKKVLRK